MIELHVLYTLVELLDTLRPVLDTLTAVNNQNYSRGTDVQNVSGLVIFMFDSLGVGGVLREQKMLKGHLNRVIYHKVH